jgi:hypothetical protein
MTSTLPIMSNGAMLLVILIGDGTAMRDLPLMIALITGGLLSQCAAWADGVDAAFRLCATLESTLPNTECEVDAWESTIDVKMDKSSSEARKICSQAAGTMTQRGSFEGKWILRVFSPWARIRSRHALCTSSYLQYTLY